MHRRKKSGGGSSSESSGSDASTAATSRKSADNDGFKRPHTPPSVASGSTSRASSSATTARRTTRSQTRASQAPLPPTESFEYEVEDWVASTKTPLVGEFEDEKWTYIASTKPVALPSAESPYEPIPLPSPEQNKAHRMWKKSDPIRPAPNNVIGSAMQKEDFRHDKEYGRDVKKAHLKFMHEKRKNSKKACAMVHCIKAKPCGICKKCNLRKMRAQRLEMRSTEHSRREELAGNVPEQPNSPAQSSDAAGLPPTAEEPTSPEPSSENASEAGNESSSELDDVRDGNVSNGARNSSSPKRKCRRGKPCGTCRRCRTKLNVAINKANSSPRSPKSRLANKPAEVSQIADANSSDAHTPAEPIDENLSARPPDAAGSPVALNPQSDSTVYSGCEGGSEASSSRAHSPAIRRKRGRPRKYHDLRRSPVRPPTLSKTLGKTKTVEHPTQDSPLRADTRDELDKAHTTLSDSSIADDTYTAPKKRGRSRKVLPYDSDSTLSSIQIAPKRPRGRPRKTQETDTTDGGTVQTIERSTARPSKYRPNPNTPQREEPPPTQADKTGENIEPTQSEQSLPRRRGRPRKHRRPDANAPPSQQSSTTASPLHKSAKHDTRIEYGGIPLPRSLKRPVRMPAVPLGVPSPVYRIADHTNEMDAEGVEFEADDGEPNGMRAQFEPVTIEEVRTELRKMAHGQVLTQLEAINKRVAPPEPQESTNEAQTSDSTLTKARMVRQFAGFVAVMEAAKQRQRAVDAQHSVRNQNTEQGIQLQSPIQLQPERQITIDTGALTLSKDTNVRRRCARRAGSCSHPRQEGLPLRNIDGIFMPSLEEVLAQEAYEAPKQPPGYPAEPSTSTGIRRPRACEPLPPGQGIASSEDEWTTDDDEPYDMNRYLAKNYRSSDRQTAREERRQQEALEATEDAERWKRMLENLVPVLPPLPPTEMHEASQQPERNLSPSPPSEMQEASQQPQGNEPLEQVDLYDLNDINNLNDATLGQYLIDYFDRSVQEQQENSQPQPLQTQPEPEPTDPVRRQPRRAARDRPRVPNVNGHDNVAGAPGDPDDDGPPSDNDDDDDYRPPGGWGNVPGGRHATHERGTGRQLPINRRPNLTEPPSCFRTETEKAKFRAAVRNQTYNIALDPDAQVEQHFLGELNVRCVHCGALFYEREPNQRYSPCCTGGKVPYRPPPTPPDFVRKFDGSTSDTKKNRRSLQPVNARVQLGALEAKSQAIRGGGPPVIKVQGQPRVMMHNPRREANPSDLHSIDHHNNSKLIGFVSGHDFANLVGNNSVDPQFLGEVADYLSTHNPLYKIFKRMWKVVEEQREAGREEVEVMLTLKDPRLEKELTAEQRNQMALPIESNELAALYETRSIPSLPLVYVSLNGKKISISNLHPLKDSLVYPMLYPHGYKGWTPHEPHRPEYATAKRNQITMNQHARALMYRRQPLNIIHRGGMVYQQQLIDWAAQIQALNLEYIKKQLPQGQMMANRRDLRRVLEATARRQNLEVGKSAVLPVHYRGGQAHMDMLRDQIIDVIRAKGCPDLFVTFTANPNWPELKNNPDVIPPQDLTLHPDMVARVFRAKLNDLQKQITDGMIFGPCKALIVVKEYQKRGLPHAHMLVTLHNKIRDGDDVDRIISCDIPDPDLDPDVYATVKTSMLHSKCDLRCQKNGKCSKGFPQPYRERTILDDGKGFVGLKRLRGGRTVTVNGKTYDTRHVVPYNKYLLKRYGAHINVVPFVNMRMVFYITKYICKGYDQARVKVQMNLVGQRINPDRPTRNDNIFMAMRTEPPAAGAQPRVRGEPGVGDEDEDLDPFPEPQRASVLIDQIEFVKDCTYRTAHEAASDILNDQMYFIWPHPVMLAVHTEESKRVMYPEGQQLRAAMMQPRDTTLDAYFKLNRRDDPVLNPILDELRYVDVPERFVFHKEFDASGRDTGNRYWAHAVGGYTQNIGSLNRVSPKSRELWFLRRLLMHKKRPRGYEDLRTVNGELHATYRDACLAMGLLHDDAEFDRALQEASLEMTAFAFRLLFFMVMLHGQPSNPNVLFEKYWQRMAGRYRQRGRTDQEVKARLLRYLARKLLYNHAELDPVMFDGVDIEQRDDDVQADEDVDQNLPVPPPDVIAANRAKANEQQLAVVDRVMNALRTREGPRLFFLEGPAGTGKTFTYKLLWEIARSENFNVLCGAFTGVAAILLPEGRTLHSLFGAPVPLTCDSKSWFERHFKQYKKLQAVNLIILDEVTMAPSHMYNLANEIVREAHKMPDNDPSLFGRAVVLCGGDPRQIGPIPSDVETAEEIHFRNTALLQQCEKIFLTRNMRTLPTEEAFAEELKRVGEGRHTQIAGHPADHFHVPTPWVKSSVDELCDWAFEDNPSFHGEKRAVLTHTNADCNRINLAVMNKMPGDLTTLLSADELADKDLRTAGLNAVERAQYETGMRGTTVDQLNLMQPPGFPPHELNLKVGAIAILTRNLDVASGLVNGTRLRIRTVSQQLVTAEVIAGAAHFVNTIIGIIRVTIEGPFDKLLRMERTQFPIKAAFCMTINKSQGQTLERVGIYLPRPISDHGKLYVGLSRVRSEDDVKMVIDPVEDKQGYDVAQKKWFTVNEVNRRLWDLSYAAPVVTGAHAVPPRGPPMQAIVVPDQLTGHAVPLEQLLNNSDDDVDDAVSESDDEGGQLQFFDTPHQSQNSQASTPRWSQRTHDSDAEELARLGHPDAVYSDPSPPESQEMLSLTPRWSQRTHDSDADELARYGNPDEVFSQPIPSLSQESLATTPRWSQRSRDSDAEEMATIGHPSQAEAREDIFDFEQMPSPHLTQTTDQNVEDFSAPDPIIRVKQHGRRKSFSQQEATKNCSQNSTRSEPREMYSDLAWNTVLEKAVCRLPNCEFCARASRLDPTPGASQIYDPTVEDQLDQMLQNEYSIVDALQNALGDE